MEESLYLVDGGFSINSPFPLVLQPERDVDVILSFNFSWESPFEVRDVAEIKAQNHIHDGWYKLMKECIKINRYLFQILLYYAFYCEYHDNTESDSCNKIQNFSEAEIDNYLK